MTEAARARSFSDLGPRLLTAAVALPLVLALVFLGPPLATAALVAGFGLVGLHEFHVLLAARGIRAYRLLGGVIAAAIGWEVALPGSFGAALWPAAALLASMALLGGGRDMGERVTTVAATLLGAVYLGGLCGAIAGLRLAAPLDRGPWRILLLLAVIMAADTAAYFVGNVIGRHKLAPSVSPGKTWEGFAGGMAGGVAGALAVRAAALTELPLADAALLGLGVAALGAAGDLVESVLKRWAGVKDSGTLFPGHGGVLDRLDSLLFGAPVLYYYFVFVR
ncbi:MAG TPA: phosphatidate cytidylyltransferase [Vicinamibacteria bacterium]